MKLPWQKTEDASASSSAQETSPAAPAGSATNAADSASAEKLPKGYTPPKGRPTPRRRTQEIERGVIRDPNAARSPAQRSAQRKELKKSMSKAEWKAYKAKEREAQRKAQREAQAAMDRGDERYLLPRDKGVERAFVRDFIDSKRYLNNFVMPVALVLLVILFIGNYAPQVANIMSIGAMILMVAFFLEGVWLGSKTNRAVRAKFPNTTAAGLGLGFYAYSRATQPRKWRTPKPRVNLGDQV